jgi:hypothetical protein
MAEASKDYYQLFSTNAYKGESYVIKFKNNPTIFTGIPIIREGVAGSSNTFQFKITGPGQVKGVFQKQLDDIDYVKEIPD